MCMHAHHKKHAISPAPFPAAGPKLRKWYGQGERLPQDGGNGLEEEEAEEMRRQEVRHNA